MKGRRATAALSLVLMLTSIGLLAGVRLARAGAGTVVAKARTVTISLKAFARVEPVSLVRLRAAQAGVVVGLKLLPGETVAAGTVLGHLGGPAAEAALARRKNAATGARTDLTAARRILQAERERKREHLSTLKEVYQAEAALAAAKARFDTARSELEATRALLTLRAPATGAVLSLEAAAGERVGPGQTLLTIQPAGGLWLRAVFYGREAAAVRVGMGGRFEPADGAAPIPVKVRTIIGTLQAGGGEAVGLEAVPPAPAWRSGEAGTVTLKGTRRTFVAVPTRALVLDKGRWWVLVHTGKGNQPRAVVPGPSRGTSTLIEKGLEPGAEVVVENAYLEFHREFSRSYQPPD